MPTATATPRTPDQPRALVGPSRATAALGTPSTSHCRTPGSAGRRATGRRQGGQATIQTAILLPLVLLLIIGCVQATLWFAGRQVAIAAASEGARVTAAEGGTTQTGQAAAVQFAGTTGRGFLLVPHVSVARTETTATVTVTGTTQSLVGGAGLSIIQTATMPVERLTVPADTGAP